ncbi:hypothetical protein RM812_42085, partial [Streptomyces sp. DSM 40712]|nr:hypothetical protein [Streptomyces sp. DSM 40712]
ALNPAVSSAAVPTSEDLDEQVTPSAPDSEAPLDFDEVIAEVLDEQTTASSTDMPDELDETSDGAAGPAHLEGPPADEAPQQHPSPEAAAVQAPRPPLARVTAVTSHILAALNTPPDPPAAPQIRVLGTVDVVGALGRVESYRRNSLTEIAAWLVLHPGRNRHELDEAIWPGQRVNAKTRNTSISKLRTWLGRDPRLPADAPDSTYLLPVTDGVYS